MEWVVFLVPVVLILVLTFVYWRARGPDEELDPFHGGIGFNYGELGSGEGDKGVEPRDEDEREAAERLLTDLQENEYHITEAVERGAEHGLAKRRVRAFVDHWTETGEVDEEYRNEEGPGRPKRYVGYAGGE